ncbi:DUF411 domain-containing protein [Niveibacterium sp.]|uniref:DUF411 domain-containing protein n=1 Tax=Niveibacterium sp. TaxID=2017444 RepID=UPI0035B0745E
MKQGLIALALAALSSTALAASLPEVISYKNPSCGCCGGWAAHMRQAGFKVTEKPVEDMDAIKRRLGVPAAAASCHTATVGGYVVEGHVPAASVKRLLAEKPKVAGIAAPGMPAGSPGMEGSAEPPYEVVSFTREGALKPYARYIGTRQQ